ncbi:hypothetical protein FA95DRAFT_1598114, partial [Auriscalpium vulgare]
MATTPLDIHIVVIEWVYRSSQHAAIDYPTLRACALVCRAWTPIAQRLLFRRVPVPKTKIVKLYSNIMARFVRTLRTAPHLAAHVRSFILELEGIETKPEVLDDAMEALALCTNVDGITIGPFDADAGFMAHLETLPVRPSFLSLSGRYSVVDHVIQIVIQIWPSLRILDIGAVSYVALDTHLRMPRELQALSTSAWTSWSASNTAAPLLGDLELRCHDGSAFTKLASFGMAAQLRSLCLVGSGGELKAPPPAVLEQLAALESLVLDILPSTAYVLPINLRHLG